MRKTWVTIAVLAAVLAPSASASDRGWWKLDRPAHHTTVQNETFVFVRDGTPIHCVVAQPGDPAGNASAGPFPSLITVFTPYGALNASRATPGGDDFWSDHGYVAVACDIRGTGESGAPGRAVSPIENVDESSTCSAWTRQQPG